MVEMAIVSTTTNFAFWPPLKLATASDHEDRRARCRDIMFTRTGVPNLRVEDAEEARERAVVGGDGEDAVAADHPHRARGQQRADEAQRHHAEQEALGAAVDA